MNLAFLIAGLVGVLTYALAALAFAFHASVSLQSGFATGLGWTFGRDTQPIRFWVQVAAASLFALFFLLQIVRGIWALSRIA